MFVSDSAGEVKSDEARRLALCTARVVCLRVCVCVFSPSIKAICPMLGLGNEQMLPL